MFYFKLIHQRGKGDGGDHTEGVKEDQEDKEDPNALSVNDVSYIVVFYRFPQCVVSTTIISVPCVLHDLRLQLKTMLYSVHSLSEKI